MSHVLRTHLDKITPFTDSEFDYILSHFTTKKLKKHQFLIQDGDQVLNDHFVLKGLLKATYIDNDGKQHILGFAPEDWWMSDYQAHFSGGKATLQVDCLEDSEVLCLSLQNREKICSELRKVEYCFRVKTTAGYVAQQRRILALLSSNARERYEQFLQQYPSLTKRLPKTLIAAYLGVSRETLSRLYSS